MRPDLAEAIASWDRATEVMQAAIRAVDPEEWPRASGYPDWSYKDLLAHLASGYAVRLAVLRGVVASGRPGPLPDADVANATAIDARRNTPVAQLVDEMLATRATIRGLLEALRNDQLDSVRETSSGSVALRDYVATLSRHDLDHLADLPHAEARPKQ